MKKQLELITSVHFQFKEATAQSWTPGYKKLKILSCLWHRVLQLLNPSVPQRFVRYSAILKIPNVDPCRSQIISTFMWS